MSNQITVYRTDGWRWRGLRKVTGEAIVNADGKLTVKITDTYGQSHILFPGDYCRDMRALRRRLSKSLRRKVSQINAQAREWRCWADAAEASMRKYQQILEYVEAGDETKDMPVFSFIN